MHHVKEHKIVRLGPSEPGSRMLGFMDLQGETWLKIGDWGQFGAISTSRKMQLLDNYWMVRPLTSGALVETYTTGHPEPSARQMFLTA